MKDISDQHHRRMNSAHSERMKKLITLVSYVALGLAAAVSGRSSVIGVNAWVISGATGLPDPTEVSPFQFQFAIGFTDSAGATNIIFNNLSFGYTTYAEGFAISSGAWPAPGVTYISSDQLYVASVNLIGLTPSRTYLTEVWAFDSSKRFDYSFEVTTAALPAAPRVPETTPTLVLLGTALVLAIVTRTEAERGRALLDVPTSRMHESKPSLRSCQGAAYLLLAAGHTAPAGGAVMTVGH
jgi:hypothetical protein